MVPDITELEDLWKEIRELKEKLNNEKEEYLLYERKIRESSPLIERITSNLLKNFKELKKLEEIGQNNSKEANEIKGYLLEQQKSKEHVIDKIEGSEKKFNPKKRRKEMNKLKKQIERKEREANRKEEEILKKTLKD